MGGSTSISEVQVILRLSLIRDVYSLYSTNNKRKTECVPKVYNAPSITPTKISNSVLWFVRHPYHGEHFIKIKNIKERNITMKKVFNYNSDVEKTAYLNWRTNMHEPIQNMNVLAEGYFQSALLLAKECLNNNDDKKADILIFPMLFAVNHGIELYEKSIYWSMNILLGYNSRYNDNHNIRGIWYAVKEKITQYGFGYGRTESEFNKMIINLELYLDELSITIKRDERPIDEAYHNIDFSRYPMNNRDEYHFYLKTFDNVVVDLENFIEVFDDIFNCLHALAETYYGLVVESWQQE